MNNPQVPKAKKAPSQSKNPSKRVAKNTVAKIRKNKPEPATEKEKQDVADAVCICLNMVDPLNNPVVRLGSVYGARDTAKASPYARPNAQWIDLSGNNLPQDSCIAVFRDAYCGYIDTRSGSSTNPASYVISCPAPCGTTYQPSSYMNILGWTSGPQIHDLVLYPGRVKGDPANYFYVRGGDTVVVTNNNSGSGTINVNPMSWWDEETTDWGVQNLAGIGGNYTYTAPSDGYVKFLFAAGSINGLVNVRVQINYKFLQGWCFGHHAIPGLPQNSQNIQSLKVVSASVMYTNTASPLNREGKIAGLQIAAGEWFANYFGYSNISQVIKSDARSIENGLYGYLRTTQPADFDFQEYDIPTTSNGSSNAFFNLQRNNDALIVCANVSNSFVAGQDGYYTVAYGVEYVTTDTWIQMEKPKVHPDRVMEAVYWANEFPQWHENPFHLSDIWSWIKETVKDVYSGVKEMLPYVAKGVDVAQKVAAIMG